MVKIDYGLWLEKAEYDLETAGAMLATGRYNYVAVMVQQAIEKLLKAIYVKQFDLLPTRTHNLGYLVARNHIEIDEDTELFFDDLVFYYISLRYPDVRNVSLSEIKAKKIYRDGVKVFSWLKQWTS